MSQIRDLVVGFFDALRILSGGILAALGNRGLDDVDRVESQHDGTAERSGDRPRTGELRRTDGGCPIWQ